MQNNSTNSGASVMAMGKWAAAAAFSLWASIPAAVQALLVLMVIDYATGLLKAVLNKHVSSQAGLRGLVKKTATILLVVTAHYLVRMLKLPFDFGTTLTVGFAVNEVISIVENSADIGVPIPPALLDVLLKAKSVTGRGQAPEKVKQELEGEQGNAAKAGS